MPKLPVWSQRGKQKKTPQKTVAPAAAAHRESVNGLGHKEHKRLSLLSGREKQKHDNAFQPVLKHHLLPTSDSQAGLLYDKDQYTHIFKVS